MKKIWFAAAASILSVFATGCQDNSKMEREMRLQGDSIASLEERLGEINADLAKTSSENGELKLALDSAVAENGELRDRLAAVEGWRDDASARLDEHGKVLAVVDGEKLDAINEKIEELGGEVSAAAANNEARYDEFKAMLSRHNEERAEERRQQMEEQMGDLAGRAGEAGVDFDPKDPVGSVMRIWRDPEQRNKAMDYMRKERTRQRNERLGLDEFQAGEVDRIEKETRERIQQVYKDGQATGASNEQMQQEVDQVVAEQDQQLEHVLTPEQYEEYKNSGGGMMPAGMGGLDDLAKLIPGMGGGSGEDSGDGE